MDSHILTTKIQYTQLLIGTSFILQQRDPKNFPKIQQATPNSRHQKGNLKQVPY